MNENLRRPRTALAAVLVAVALPAVAGCGSDDGGSGPSGGGGSTTTDAAAQPDGNRFEAADVGFTFAYPDGFEQVDEPDDGKVVASVTPTPNDVKNGIKIRKTAEQELEFSSYGDNLRSQFEEQLGIKIAQSEETHSGISFGVMDWSKPFTYEDLGEEKTTRLRSTSYFFAGGGDTWQIECISDSEHRTQIEQACEQALESIDFKES